MKAVSVICPFRNEKDNLEELVGRTFKALAGLYDTSAVEVIIVDDASTDSANEIINRLLEVYAGLRLITHGRKMGQAAALSSGFNSASGDIIITMDADLQAWPEDLPLFLNKMNEGYDLVNGIRLERKERLFLKLSSKLFSFLVSLISGAPIADAASNFTAVRGKFIKGLELYANDHRYIVPILKRRGALKIAEVKVRHAKRQKGRSKYSLGKVVLAVPEFFSFYSRFKKGAYDLN